MFGQGTESLKCPVLPFQVTLTPLPRCENNQSNITVGVNSHYDADSLFTTEAGVILLIISQSSLQ